MLHSKNSVPPDLHGVSTQVIQQMVSHVKRRKTEEAATSTSGGGNAVTVLCVFDPLKPFGFRETLVVDSLSLSGYDPVDHTIRREKFMEKNWPMPNTVDGSESD